MNKTILKNNTWISLNPLAFQLLNLIGTRGQSYFVPHWEWISEILGDIFKQSFILLVLLYQSQPSFSHPSRNLASLSSNLSFVLQIKCGLSWGVSKIHFITWSRTKVLLHVSRLNKVSQEMFLICMYLYATLLVLGLFSLTGQLRLL